MEIVKFVLITLLFQIADCDNVLLNLSDWEHFAKEIFESKNKSAAWTYMEGGSMNSETILANREAFDSLRIRQNVMKDVSSVVTDAFVLGSKISMPIGAAPSAMQKLWHEDGEKAMAAAVQSAGTLMILSSASSFSLEEVTSAAPNATKWFQTFLPHRDPALRNVSLDLYKRAEDAGYAAVVFTVDSPVPALRYDIMRANFDFKAFGPMGNFVKYPLYDHFRENRLSWRDFRWIREMTNLQIVVKGIMTREDAREALEAGVDGIIVSNHGGRQLDSGLATLEALPEVIDEVKGRTEVYVDGGIRSGKDVFKALAIGARAVFIGRPALWGLIKGPEGAEAIFKILKNELSSIMGQTGCASLDKIHRKHVTHKLELALSLIRLL